MCSQMPLDSLDALRASLGDAHTALRALAREFGTAQGADGMLRFPSTPDIIPPCDRPYVKLPCSKFALGKVCVGQPCSCAVC